jgi:hypothetical protein
VTWGKVDDGLCVDKKVLELLGMRGGKAALALWTVALSWCNRELTDGRVSLSQVRAMPGGFREADAARLVEATLWERLEGDTFQFRNWTKFNKTREQVLEERAKTAEKVRNFRNRKAVEKLETSGIHVLPIARGNRVTNHPVTAPPDPVLTAPAEQAASTPLRPPAKAAKRTRKLTARDHVRLRLVELFNTLYEPRYGKRSEPTSVAYCASAVTTFLNHDGTCDEEAAVASMRGYLDDAYLAARSGYSFDGWIRRCSSALTKARPAARVCNNVNRVTYDH